MARVATEATYRERTHRPQSKIYLHACGRLEALTLDQPLDPERVCSAARRAFDLPPDQALVLADKDGRVLSDQPTLSGVIDHAETIYIRLPDGALHDFERRVDQLKHMQIGYLCDQLATFRQEHAEIRAELAAVQSLLDQEQVARASGNDSLRRDMEAILHQMTSKVGRSRLDEGSGLERMKALELALEDTRQGLKEELSAHLIGLEPLQEAVKRGHEEREALVARCDALQLADEKLKGEVEALAHCASECTRFDHKLKQELEETHRAMEQEVKNREESESSLERMLCDTRKTLDNVSESSREVPGNAELRELTVANASQQADLRMAVEAERAARQQSTSELTQQLSIAVESIQEEQALRSSEGAELRRMLEGLSRSLDELRHRQEQDATSSAAASVVAVQEAVAEERAQRIREVRKAEERADDVLARIKAEQKDRARAFEELTESMAQVRSSLGEQHMPQGTAWVREIRELVDEERTLRIAELKSLGGRVDDAARIAREAASSNQLAQLRHALATEQKDRSSLESEVRAWLEEEAKAREKGDLLLSSSMHKAVGDDVLNREIADRLNREGGKTGSIGISLMWDTSDDLELHVVTPSGMEVSYNNKQQDGGTLDVDARGIAEPIQNVFWPEGGDNAPSGNYRVYLHVYSKKVDSPANWSCRILIDGQTSLFKGSCPKNGPAEVDITNFTYPQATKALEDVNAGQADFAALREGLAKVVDAVQQERRSRCEADKQLRDDCREAIEKEVSARLKTDKGLRHELEASERAIAECKRGLETHTHELRVAPEVEQPIEATERLTEQTAFAAHERSSMSPPAPPPALGRDGG